MAFQNNGSIVEKLIDRPTVFFWQQELRAFLFEKGINVYVVTASQEELVRMVVADPKYGFDIPSSSVIGMRLALRSSNAKNVLGQYDKNLNQNYYESMITSSLSGITTWYSGKVAAIKEYVDPVKKPVLVAGNSESDFAMLNYAKTDPGMKILFTKNNEQQYIFEPLFLIRYIKILSD
ncbi:hypothetical protein [Desulfobacula sp.]|uniref:hypothetical protein n=1 Tax=Desulfobacula sp. TaxID=2593537 RepID=UPI002625CC57|nr:hypothetical protein [Desulfobacula sp.]